MYCQHRSGIPSYLVMTICRLASGLSHGVVRFLLANVVYHKDCPFRQSLLITSGIIEILDLPSKVYIGEHDNSESGLDSTGALNMVRILRGIRSAAYQPSISALGQLLSTYLPVLQQNYSSAPATSSSTTVQISEPLTTTPTTIPTNHSSA